MRVRLKNKTINASPYTQKALKKPNATLENGLSGKKVGCMNGRASCPQPSKKNDL